MGQKKSKKLIIISIIIILIVLTIGGIVFAYFATDAFKSNKELFLKYASSLVDENTAFIDSNLKQYYQKLENTAYENNGALTFKVNIPDAQEITKLVDNFSINFSGKVDSAGAKVQQDIVLDYGSGVEFPISYRQVNDAVGLQTKYVGSKYIAVKNENLTQLAENLGLPSISNIPEEIDFSKTENKLIFTEDEMKQLQEKYLNVIIEELQESNFTKIKTSLGEGYQLSLNGTEFRNIIVKILDILKSDTELLDKVNQLDADSIEEIKNSINENTEIDNEKLEVIIYQQNKEVNKIIIQINEGKLEIEKIKGGNELQYLATLQNVEGTQKIYLNAKYTGVQTDNINESFELGISYPYEEEQDSQVLEYQYNYENNIRITGNVTIEEMTDDNTLVLNDLEPDVTKNLMNAIGERIAQVNQDQMEELGIAGAQNPILYIIPVTNIMKSTDRTVDNLNQQEVEVFNSKFKMYESTNIKGASVKGLLTVIKTNNEENDKKITEINFDGQEYEVTEQNITLIKSNISVEDFYKVEFEYDRDTGVVYRTIINKK